MKVTIGISFYNSETTLGDAVRSIFAQTFKDWELILIDDGSTDGSLRIARSIDDPRVSVLSDGKNLGPPARLTQLSDIANGKYLARMDADDMMHPLRIEKQVQWLDERTYVDVLDSGIWTIDSRNNPIGIRDCHALEATPRRCLIDGLLNQPTVMGRIEWMRRNRYDFDYRRAQDHELWCRAVVNGDCRFERLPEPLLFYREEGSIDLRKMLLTHAFVRRTIRRYGPRLVGVPQTWKYLAQSYMKSLAWKIACPCGIPRFLYHRRSRALSDECRNSAGCTIQTILQTDVPGMPPVAETPGGIRSNEKTRNAA